MKEQIELLVQLQERDLLADRLKKAILDGPRRIEEIEAKLKSAEAGVEAHQSRVLELQKTQRQLEADIEDGIAHIRKSRGRLMSIKNNKEYRALVKEIEETERENASREDKVLGCLEEMEGLAGQVKSEEAAVAAMERDIQSEKREIEEELARLEKELSQVNEVKEALSRDIDQKLLCQYQSIKSRNSGVAIAQVDNATCSGCHLSIPPQMYNELQRQDSLECCPHCQRLIYWKEPDPA